MDNIDLEREVGLYLGIFVAPTILNLAQFYEQHWHQQVILCNTEGHKNYYSCEKKVEPLLIDHLDIYFKDRGRIDISWDLSLQHWIGPNFMTKHWHQVIFYHAESGTGNNFYSCC
jgi:hypothetical protein